LSSSKKTESGGAQMRSDALARRRAGRRPGIDAW
jgi:hypothetical protein